MLKHTASLLPWSSSVMFLIDVLRPPFLAIIFKFEKTPACYGVLTDFHSRDPGGGQVWPRFRINVLAVFNL